MLIEIIPLDTLFFRDSKPFSMGLENWADGIFPPYPPTIYGAIRFSYLSQIIDDKDKNTFIDSDVDPTKDLQIKRILYKDSISYYLPLPYDYVKMENGKIKLAYLEKSKTYYANVDFEYYLKTIDSKQNDNFKQVDNHLITTYRFNDYINNLSDAETPNADIMNMSNKVLTEYKVGIGRSNQTKKVDSGKLYRVGMNRLAGFSIVVEYDGIDDKQFSELGVIKLGGEGKTAKLNRIEDEKINKPAFKNDDKCFKMVLSTPAYFENGWLPSWINKDSLTGTFPNTQIKIKLISVTMGKYKSIGGFDYKIRKPKPSKRFVPAGSVYYFQVLNENNINWDSILSSHGKSITDNHKENDDSIRYNYRNQGFGISYIGKCPNLS